MSATGATPLLQLDAVRKLFRLRTPFWSRRSVYVRAVDGVSVTMRPHETLGLVGETGCGKTTTARMILTLERPTSGRILFEGQDLGMLRGTALRRHRASVQAVFQDPWSSLDPRMRAGDIIAEPLIENGHQSRALVRDRVEELLVAVGLKPEAVEQFPHEFSGGQRQRIAVARALILRPSLVVLDEPVSALDVSVRAQVMNLLKDLQEQLGAAYLLIAHNLATVRYLSHRVAVMYLGQIVENAAADELFSRPLHPYTKALISAALPTTPAERRDEMILGGEVPSPVDPPAGCRFHPRCPFVFARCTTEVPELRELGPGHWTACHLY